MQDDRLDMLLNQLPEEKRTFNGELSRIREIVSLLEGSQVDLETGAKLYSSACESLGFCRTRLAGVRNEIERLNGELEKAEDFLAGE